MTGLRWAKLALEDLDAIDRYYRQEHIAVADELTSRIIDAVGLLRDMPQAGPATRRGNRKWRVKDTPFVLFYRPAADHIRILRIRHGARDNSGL